LGIIEHALLLSADVIQTDDIAGAVMELGRTRRPVGRDLLRMLNCTTVVVASGDAGGSVSVLPCVGENFGVLVVPPE
jgi:hypothetical protein